MLTRLIVFSSKHQGVINVPSCFSMICWRIQIVDLSFNNLFGDVQCFSADLQRR